MDFEGVLKIHDVLKQNAEESSLDEGTAYNDQLYITGLAALNAEKLADARPYFQKLYEAKSDKPAVYEALYRIASEENIESAYVYLEEGRRLHPDDVSLLFAEINHFLRINKLDALISKLQAAIEKEPGNISLYSTLGNVYDNLYQREFEAGNKAKSEEYFQQALSYYNQALGRDPQYFDAIYSIGALYFNRAAVLTKEQIALGVSAADQKRFDELAGLINADFEKALPYFKQCEQINPNDQNTLIALKEIFARKNDFTVSGEFKTRLEKVQAGGKNETSYFKN
jgi:tetratricopeptide (TPR) repeat protein